MKAIAFLPKKHLPKSAYLHKKAALPGNFQQGRLLSYEREAFFRCTSRAIPQAA